MTTMFRRKKKIMREREEPTGRYEIFLIVAMVIVAGLLIYVEGV